ncbi:hypothetical protein K3495_g16758, partial [Podosphaera aphanis]
MTDHLERTDRAEHDQMLRRTHEMFETMLTDVTSGQADPISSMARVLNQHPDIQSVQEFSAAFERQISLSRQAGSSQALPARTQYRPPAPPTPRSFDFGFPSSPPPRQLVHNTPGSVRGPTTALVPYGQPIAPANTDDSLFEGCSRETHYPIPQRRHSAHPFVREPSSWSGQMCCIRCGKADHYVPQCTTH